MKSAHNMKGKGQRPHTNKQIDGKGKGEDPYFNYNMTILIGCSAEVTTRDGEVYEGIYVAFSAAMEILLEAAHLVTSDSKDDTSIEKHFDVLVIPSEKVLSMKCLNADLTYPTREFATDTAISSSRGGGVRDKELTPWECSDDTPDELTLESAGGGGGNTQNGWEAKDMFKKNEEKYGVVSSFNHDLSGYTTQVDKNDTEFKRLEEQANQIAQEIEKGPVSWERTQVENGDEEEAFSAVVRPRNNASNSHTTVNNNNNNNTSSVPSDKYVPPSRRQNNLQPSAPPPTQSHPHPHPPSNNNGPSHNSNNNNSGMPRKPIYNQNQNPRSNYGAPPNVVYHQDRRNFDSRRAPPPNQYGNSSGHGDVRRPPEDVGPRPQRMNKQVPLDRKDPAKLKEFGNTFRLQSQDPSQMRRLPPGNPPPQQVGVGMPPHVLPQNSAPAPSRNQSPPSAPSSISSNKANKKEEPSPASLPPLIHQCNTNTLVTSEAANPPSAAASPLATSNSSVATPATSSAVSTRGSPNTPNVANISVSENTPTSTSSMTSPASSDNQTPSSSGDSKSGEESKKKFTFNPNAKEFNPKFSTRSPSTPPRPPSTPATVATQVMTAPPIPPYMPIMQPATVLYAPPQPYGHAQAALTPSSNSSTSSGVTTPRHGGHRKGVPGMPPRSEMTPPIQMTAGPPILTPATAIQAAPPSTHYFVTQGYPSVAMRVLPQGVMPVAFQPEGSGGSQMHPPLQFLPPNGATQPNNTGHQPNNTPPNNPNAPSNVVPSNGHGYGQPGGSHSGSHHMGYSPHIVQLPVTYGYPSISSGPPNVIQYVPHQGGTTVIPQSQ